MKLDLLAPFAFPLSAFWGRLSQIFAIENYEYLFKKESSSIHQKHWKGLIKEIIPSFIIICLGIIFFLFSNSVNISRILLLVYFILSGLITSLLIPYLLNKYLEGHNGDSYGASLVITETIYLFLLSIILVVN